MKKESGILVIFIILCAVLSIMNPRLLSMTNLQNMGRLVGMFGIFSIGIGLVIITGGIDLSPGSVFAWLGVLMSFMLTRWHWPWPLVVIIIIITGIMIGYSHGVLVTRVRIQPFIVTLIGLMFYRGLARFVAQDSTMGFGYHEGFETLGYLATGNLLGVPTPLILLVLISILA